MLRKTDESIESKNLSVPPNFNTLGRVQATETSIQLLPTQSDAQETQPDEQQISQERHRLQQEEPISRPVNAPPIQFRSFQIRSSVVVPTRLQFIEEQNEDDPIHENSSSPHNEFHSDGSTPLHRIVAMQPRSSPLTSGLQTPKTDSQSVEMERLIGFMSSASRPFFSSNQEQFIPQSHVNYLKTQLEQQQLALIEALQQNQQLYQKIEQQQMSKQQTTQAIESDPSPLNLNMTPEIDKEYSKLKSIVTEIYRPINFNTRSKTPQPMQMERQTTPTLGALQLQLSPKRQRSTFMRTRSGKQANTIKEDPFENINEDEDFFKQDLEKFLLEDQTEEHKTSNPKSQSQINEHLTALNKANSRTRPGQEHEFFNLQRPRAGSRKRSGQEHDFFNLQRPRAGSKGNLLFRQNSSSSSEELFHQNSGAQSQFTFVGKNKHDHSNNSSLSHKSIKPKERKSNTSIDNSGSPLPRSMHEILTPTLNQHQPIARRGRNLIRTVKQLTKGQSTSASSELTSVFPLIHKQFMLQDLSKQNLLRVPELITHAERVAKETFLKIVRKRRNLVPQLTVQAMTPQPIQMSAVTNWNRRKPSFKELGPLNTMQPARHGTGSKSSVVIREFDHDFSPSNCEIPVSQSSQVFNENSSQHIDKSDNTFNPMDYEYIPVQHASDSISANSQFISGASISDMSKRDGSRLRKLSQKQVTDWTTQFSPQQSGESVQIQKQNTALPKSHESPALFIKNPVTRIKTYSYTPISRGSRTAHFDQFFSDLNKRNNMQDNTVDLEETRVQVRKNQSFSTQIQNYMEPRTKPRPLDLGLASRANRLPGNTQLSPILQDGASLHTSNSKFKKEVELFNWKDEKRSSVSSSSSSNSGAEKPNVTVGLLQTPGKSAMSKVERASPMPLKWKDIQRVDDNIRLQKTEDKVSPGSEEVHSPSFVPNEKNALRHRNSSSQEDYGQFRSRTPETKREDLLELAKQPNSGNTPTPDNSRRSKTSVKDGNLQRRHFGLQAHRSRTAGTNLYDIAEGSESSGRNQRGKLDKEDTSKLTDSSFFYSEKSPQLRFNQFKIEKTDVSTTSTQPYDRLKHQVTITTTSNISTANHGKQRINQYQIIKRIGEGSFSQVFLCFDVNTDTKYAMKVMDKTSLKTKLVGENETAYTQVQQEMAIMKKLDHPNVLKLFEIIDNPAESKLYLITEFVKNGTLASRIRKKDLNEAQMRKIFRQLITAIEYCHKVPKIVHRDIKPDNILIDANDNVKLGDFGVSLLLPEDGNEIIRNNAGSDKFFSPEACMSSTYKGRQNDLWACGVTLYLMATGEFPFKGQHQKLFREIQEKKQTYPAHIEGTPLCDIIEKLLVKQPEERLTISEIKQHPWLTMDGPMPDIIPGDYSMPTPEDIANLVTHDIEKQYFKITKKNTYLSGPASSEGHLTPTPKRHHSFFGSGFTGLKKDPRRNSLVIQQIKQPI